MSLSINPSLRCLVIQLPSKFTDVMYEVDKDFKDQIKRLKFGPFIKGFISQEVDDEYSDGTPKSYTDVYNLFTPREIFQAPNSIEEYIVDE